MIKENVTTTSTELANLFGVSDRHIRDLAVEGYIVRTERGKYYLFESIKGYIKYLEDRNSAPADVKEAKIKEEIERLKKDTELKKLRIQEMKNQLHSADTIKEVMVNMLMNMKGKLLSISNKLAPLIIGMDNLGEIQDAIQSEILESLEELSDYDSELFKSKKFIEIDEEIEEIEQQRKKGRPKKSK